MRYFFAAIACVTLLFLYAVVAAANGWKHGGGAIPMMMLCGAIMATWIGIVRGASPTNKRTPQPLPTAPRASQHTNPASEQAHYEIVACELESQQLVSGTWARAFADSSGAPDQARALYIRYRVAQMTDARTREQQEQRQAAARATRQRVATGFRRFVCTISAFICGILSLFCAAGGISMLSSANESWGGGIFFVVLAILFGWATYGWLRHGRRLRMQRVGYERRNGREGSK